MTSVSLAEAKAHLRSDGDADDALIIGAIEAAEQWLSAIGVATAAPVPAPVRQAILIIVSGLIGGRDMALRSHTVEGAFAETFVDPARLQATRERAVERLIAPFREQIF